MLAALLLNNPTPTPDVGAGRAYDALFGRPRDRRRHPVPADVGVPPSTPQGTPKSDATALPGGRGKGLEVAPTPYIALQLSKTELDQLADSIKGDLALEERRKLAIQMMLALMLEL